MLIKCRSTGCKSVYRFCALHQRQVERLPIPSTTVPAAIRKPRLPRRLCLERAPIPVGLAFMVLDFKFTTLSKCSQVESLLGQTYKDYANTLPGCRCKSMHEVSPPMCIRWIPAQTCAFLLLHRLRSGPHRYCQSVSMLASTTFASNEHKIPSVSICIGKIAVTLNFPVRELRWQQSIHTELASANSRLTVQ